MAVLSWNKIRARAAGFAEEWTDAGYEKARRICSTKSFFRSLA